MLVESEIKIIESPVRDDMYFYQTTMIGYKKPGRFITGRRKLKSWLQLMRYPHVARNLSRLFGSFRLQIEVDLQAFAVGSFHLNLFRYAESRSIATNN